MASTPTTMPLPPHLTALPPSPTDTPPLSPASPTSPTSPLESQFLLSPTPPTRTNSWPGSRRPTWGRKSSISKSNSKRERDRKRMTFCEWPLSPGSPMGIEELRVREKEWETEDEGVGEQSLREDFDKEKREREESKRWERVEPVEWAEEEGGDFGSPPAQGVETPPEENEKVELKEEEGRIEAEESEDDAEANVLVDEPVTTVDVKGKGKAVETEIEVDSEYEEEAGPAPTPSVFGKLPEEIIQQILTITDAPTFSSLRLLNRTWRRSAHKESLYHHHLSSLGISFPEDAPLNKLTQKFAQESLRRLFPSALQPTLTSIRLISSSPSSSGAFPGGDPFRFEFSSKGSYLLAFSSSHLVVLDMLASPPLVKRELKISRRPASAAILDDGSVLAVLTAEAQVLLYDLTGPKVKVTRKMGLESAPRAIALGPGAAILAAAYDFGIEVYSLDETSLGHSTERRTLPSDPVDSLRFSSDGSVLLGTTLHSRSPTTVIISAPFFSIDTDLSLSDTSESSALVQIWTTQVLFPRSSRDNSHATLLPAYALGGEEDENSWAFTFDRVFEIYRAVRVDDLRNGQTYFPGPVIGEQREVVPPSTLPAPNKAGDLVAAGFRGGDIYLYGVPGKLDPSATTCGTAGDRNGMAPQWATLKERGHNAFVHGRQIASIPHLTGLRFISNPSAGEQLVAVASGSTQTNSFSFSSYEEECEMEEPDEGGMICLFSFETNAEARKTSIVIELGLKTPETLPDPRLSMQTHINLLRRATIHAASGGNTSRGGRRPSIPPPMPSSSTFPITPQPFLPPSPPSPTHTQRPITPPSPTSSTHSIPPIDPTDDPYTPSMPRSRTTLYRAATTARPRPQHTFPPRAPIPLYDDRDGWVPPPPAYEESWGDRRVSPQAFLVQNIQGAPPASQGGVIRAVSLHPRAMSVSTQAREQPVEERRERRGRRPVTEIISTSIRPRTGTRARSRSRSRTRTQRAHAQRAESPPAMPMPVQVPVQRAQPPPPIQIPPMQHHQQHQHQHQPSIHSTHSIHSAQQIIPPPRSATATPTGFYRHQQTPTTDSLPNLGVLPNPLMPPQPPLLSPGLPNSPLPPSPDVNSIPPVPPIPPHLMGLVPRIISPPAQQAPQGHPQHQQVVGQLSIPNQTARLNRRLSRTASRTFQGLSLSRTTSIRRRESVRSIVGSVNTEMRRRESRRSTRGRRDLDTASVSVGVSEGTFEEEGGRGSRLGRMVRGKGRKNADKEGGSCTIM